MTFAMDFNAKDFKEMRETRLEDLGTIHPLVTKAADLFEKLRSFDDTALLSKTAFSLN